MNGWDRDFVLFPREVLGDLIEAVNSRLRNQHSGYCSRFVAFRDNLVFGLHISLTFHVAADVGS